VEEGTMDAYDRILEEQIISLDTISSKVVRRGLEHWKSLSANGKFPSRSDISPRPIASILGSTLIIRVLENGQEFQIVIAGEALRAYYGAWVLHATTADADRYMPGFGRLIWKACRTVWESAKPLALRGVIASDLPAGHGLGKVVRYECVYLPLGSGPTSVDHIMAVSDSVAQDVSAAQYQRLQAVNQTL
jgi:hypothetical protein